MEMVFDIETNGLLYQPWTWSKKRRENPPPIADRVHCICLSVVGSGKVETYHNDPSIPRDGDLLAARNRLHEADVLIGHNIIRFDIPALKQLMDWEPLDNQKFRDTLVMSHMGYTSLFEKDKRIKRNTLSPALYGKHSLRAWGYRIGLHKGHVNDTEDWSTLDEDMAIYCARDVEVNVKLYKMFQRSWASKIPDAVEVEHQFFIALESQKNCGWHIDQDKAWALLRKLERERGEMEKSLLTLFPPRVVPPTHIYNEEPQPEKNLDPEGWAAWEKWVPNPEAEPSNMWWNAKPLKTRKKVYPFKPSSSQQVIYWLNKKYGWEPTVFSTKGNPKFGEEIIAALPYEETKDLVRYAQVTSRISELTGDSGYLTLLWEDGRLHGGIEHCGAVTHRCTHQRPNMGNVTGITNRSGRKQLYGREMRELFSVPDDSYVIVGADASGLELRMLGNRMAKSDGGEFAEEVVSGDQHTKNAEMMHLEDWFPQQEGEDEKAWRKRLRTGSKPIIYALNYGAANKRLGECLVPPGEVWSESKLKREGGKVRKNLMAGLPALDDLIKSLKTGWHPGATIEGLDGRLAENRAAYQALNTQLQMDGAVVIKWATVFVHQEARRRWGPPAVNGMWCMVGHVHDEYQFQVKKEIADAFGELAVRAITQAGEALGVVCRLDGEFKVGRSWADTH